MSIDWKIIIIIILGILLIYYLLTTFNESLYIKSDIDNHFYSIQKGDGKTETFMKDSVNTLGEINIRITKLINHLVQNYSNDPDKNYFIKKLKENYDPHILSEAAIDNRYTTYTIDKHNMHICLRSRDEYEKLYNINTLIYVIFHEIGHLCNYDKNGNPIYGHGPEFMNIFKFLLEESIKIGIYKYEDYKSNPINYCGLVISNNILG